ncbi:unnamed protein product [Rhizophagus irregularis]|nr:unnamed protein product [Rhizophagus irregularis]
MQNSISRSIISTTMEIPKHVVIEENLRQIEIRINRDVKDKNENISPGERINEAICQVDKLIEDIEMRNRRKDIEKEGKNGRISDNRNQQHATPRNHKNNDPKEKRKRPKRRVPHTTQENVRTVNRTNYNQSN